LHTRISTEKEANIVMWKRRRRNDHFARDSACLLEVTVSERNKSQWEIVFENHKIGINQVVNLNRNKKGLPWQLGRERIN
jgi:hypothetical protein